ncbi:CPBP family intramembrane glutamic endopeptidase [Thalassobacillus hwangdonensis]|uniref:CPBP family intramembrane glutamic endopeptidase n=1 Tax=Thalassobacillus hwangdonensis TaxID=546108 RepID=UPI0036DEBE68
MFSVIVLVAIYEEVIFRGMVQHWLTNKVGSIVAILITSVLFGWMHGDYELFGMTMGIAFGFIYHLKRSLSAAILLHMLWNLISSFSM